MVSGSEAFAIKDEEKKRMRRIMSARILCFTLDQFKLVFALFNKSFSKWTAMTTSET